MYSENLEVVKVGPLRLFKAILDRIHVIPTINAVVRWDEAQWKISPGTLIAAMMMAVFCGRRALFSLNKMYARQDLELLFGRADLSPEDFNDDALGRALDRLAESNVDEIVGGIILRAFTEYSITADALHADTTSISVYGDYANFNDAPLAIVHGHNKDHRPDLKQFKYGLAVNGDGIPVYGEVLDGNLSDKTWSRDFLENAPKLKRIMTGKTVIVADSAAMSAMSIHAIKEHCLRVVSRLPENFSLCDELMEKALAEGAWQASIHSDDAKKNEGYQLQAFRAFLVNDEYAFIVVRSESLEKRKEKTVEKAVAVEAARLDKALAALAKKRFASLDDAENAWNEETGKLAVCYHTLSCSIQRYEEVIARPRPGRPRKGEAAAGIQVLYGVEGKATRDEDRIRHTKAKEGTFVLFSSAPDLSPSETMRVYKEQWAVERRFQFLKDPYFVGAVNLKLPHRVQALGYVMLLTLLIYSLFEWSVREGLKRENEPYHVAGSYRTYRPRGNTVLPELDDVTVLLIPTPEGFVRKLPSNYSRTTERIVRLCGFDMSIYVKPPLPQK